MFIVKVAWDARNQQFRLMDQKLSNMFEDGDMYLLVVDFLPTNPKSMGTLLTWIKPKWDMRKLRAGLRVRIAIG